MHGHTIPVLRALAFLLLTACTVTPTVRGQVRSPLPVRVDRSPEMRLEYQRAERAWRSGSSLPEARTRLDRVLATIPEDREARRLRARVLLDMDLWSRALDDARILTDTDTSDGTAWLLLSESLLRTDAPGKSLTALERGAALVTEGVEAHLRMSSIAQELGQVDRAEAFARVALALGPTRPAAYRRLAHVFVAQGRESDAVTLLAKGLDEGVVPPRMISGDPILARLATRPGLQGRFAP